MRSRVLTAIAVWVVAAMAPPAAMAHAELDSARPAAGSVAVTPPPEVSLWFTEALEPNFSTIEVKNAEGVTMQAGPATLAPDNPARLRVPLKPLPPGTYTVIWRVLSVDTHRSEGTYTFTVR